MRRAGFLATLAAGFALVAASLHGMAGVDQTLKVAAAPPPATESQYVRDDHWCERDRDRRERPPEV